MSRLINKRILVGVTGGIAAYKSADLVRRLRGAGAEVRVVMTLAANEFITPLTLQAVSGHPVYQKLLDTDAEAGMGHIEIARWADAVLIAPASADFLARLVHGRADDLLSAICLATAAPVAVAPAMNQQMWSNAATQENLKQLRARKLRVFGPAAGEQACGEIGLGRMLEPVDLVEQVADLFATGELDGLKVVVTAGPTWEAIDPVRAITNKSSGKMGYAVATAAAEAGAQVVLISGPTNLPDPARVQTVRVISAEEMYQAVQAQLNDVQVFIGVAAVADYRPVKTTAHKIKKTSEQLTIELVRNPDILAAVAKHQPRIYTVGFAAETDDLETYARAKLQTKNIDLVAANLVGAQGLGFEADDNELLLVDRTGSTPLTRAPKGALARALIHEIALRYHAESRTQDSRQARR
ncbi:MAG: bifunctional phosphopantothenoylcysteine decarboxylase/phosphopantothenate--cysteine ligase CoaBC [Gammaproteobacteria bacterium]|nr:bifunctional phosphopantothenoylcysteine decarboxylase/phosphopantothenate--cysteine ligase CoaBC [Gammaproteobacteria bacterium]